MHIFDCCLLIKTITAVVCYTATLNSQRLALLIDLCSLFFSVFPLAQWNYYGVAFTLLDM